MYYMKKPPSSRAFRERPRNGGPTMRVGDRVRINAPENSRLHESEAIIVGLTEWGAHLEAPQADTKQFRATWEEMILLADYVGECCPYCGSLNLRWAGKCKLCDNCGQSNGCS